ncbi:MAG: alpha-ribazole phosphatase [Negativicutes bacterium]|nr:alpha-ribazole phosphatase [Negativicutes bacterium]
MTKLILVRHGETIWNMEKKFQGHTDIALSEEGARQASLVADRLATEKIAAVYSSDLSRAFVTAETIASRHGLAVTAMPAFREMKFGEWEGLSYTAIHEKWPDELNGLFTKPDELVIPGGETFRELKDRAAAALAELVARHENETFVVVSHAGTIRTVFCSILDIHLNHLWDIRQDNTAVNVVEYFEDRALIALVNDSHHLRSGKV